MMQLGGALPAARASPPRLVRSGNQLSGVHRRQRWDLTGGDGGWACSASPACSGILHPAATAVDHER